VSYDGAKEVAYVRHLWQVRKQPRVRVKDPAELFTSKD